MSATATTPITPKQFAELLTLAWKIREKSYFKPTGLSDGGYTKTEERAVEEAVTKLGMHLAWVLPAYILMSTDYGEVSEWAEEYAK